MIWKILLLVHAIVACALIGLVTHQASAVLFSGKGSSLIGSYASVRSAIFTKAIVVAFSVEFFLGSWIYTRYRYTARPVLEDLGLESYVGAFEFKEHLLAICLFVLPVYWLFWARIPLDERSKTRTALTIFVGFSIWAAFLIGHLLNNERGI